MGTGKPSGHAAPAGVFSFADVQVDAGAHRLTRAGTEVGLEPKAFAVLLELLAHPDQMLSRDQLLDAVWGHAHVTQATLNRLVVQLRRALRVPRQSTPLTDRHDVDLGPAHSPALPSLNAN
ncbi:hypothetical protein GCM10008098_10220 [Rhodanobacter panaciterrae]|uniref:OmpR/PhoB-type domain-containing protein n=1 Tax=Rhodanobacter panaciterrae TaxID=490572 RepID=A0ABQ2ZNE0_9GAMM|nr:winged helix-turn-helix domain-containing protein [Rhodanobacter panaciterrae]GGY19790.1 hypothetical protein GCM10008098_10220 [Rhodanobacter panaciterrae]